MVFLIALWALLAGAEGNGAQSHVHKSKERHHAHRGHPGVAAQQRARERVAETAADFLPAFPEAVSGFVRPATSSLAQQEVVRSRFDAAGTRRHPRRSDRSGSHDRSSPEEDSSVEEALIETGLAHYVGRMSPVHKGKQPQYNDEEDTFSSSSSSPSSDDYSPEDRSGYRKDHHGAGEDDNSDNGGHRHDIDPLKELLHLQDGHRAKSVEEREAEAEAFCSRKDLTKKESEGCRVRKNAARMGEYALHVTDAMRMKRIVEAGERVAQSAAKRAEEESANLEELERQFDGRRVTRVHERPRAHAHSHAEAHAAGDMYYVLHERKIELALVLFFGGLLLTCVTVYSKKDPPPRRLRLVDHPDEQARAPGRETS